MMDMKGLKLFRDQIWQAVEAEKSVSGNEQTPR